MAETLAPKLLAQLVKAELPPGTFLNVTFPRCAPAEVQGIEVTSQGKLDFGLEVQERADGRGFPYYWLRFGDRGTKFREGTDLQALKEDKISVSPLKLDMTDYAAQDSIARALGFGVAD